MLEAVVAHRSLDDLVEEQLIGLVEVGPESLVDDVDELRNRTGCSRSFAASPLQPVRRASAPSPSLSVIDPSLIFCSR